MPKKTTTKQPLTPIKDCPVYSTLSDKHKAFVDEYIQHLNITDAYQFAYPNCTRVSASVKGSELLSKVNIQEAIQERKVARAKRVEVNQDDVLRAVMEIAFVDPIDLFNDDGTLKPLKDIPVAARRAIGSLDVEEIFIGSGEDRVSIGNVKKLRMIDKKGPLSDLMKHLGISGVNKHELTGKDGADLPQGVVINFVGKPEGE